MFGGFGAGASENALENCVLTVLQYNWLTKMLENSHLTNQLIWRLLDLLWILSRNNSYIYGTHSQKYLLNKMKFICNDMVWLSFSSADNLTAHEKSLARWLFLSITSSIAQNDWSIQIHQFGSTMFQPLAVNQLINWPKIDQPLKDKIMFMFSCSHQR